MVKKIKKSMIWVILLIFTLDFLPSNFVQAVSDINIISSTNVTANTAKKWASSKGATQAFIALADLYWKYANDHGGVNPAIAYAQAAKETGFGNFGGVIDASYYNPCGLKTESGGDDSDPNAHQKFNSWDEGVQAHLDHLALYAGASGYPRSNTYDPRHFSQLLGTAKTVIALGAKWATGSTYGTELMTLYNNLVDMQNSEDANNIGPFGWIDNPQEGFSTSGKTLNISGWALNNSGIKEIQVYIDGQYKGNISSIGESRADVAKVYPYYSNAAQSGYSGTIDISSLSGGTKKLTLKQVGNNGAVYECSRNFTVNKLSMLTSIDYPSSNFSTSSGTLRVSGWALNGAGIKAINIYIDGVLKKTVTTTLDRADVKAVYPQYKNVGNVGFDTQVDITDVAGGQRKLKIEQVGNDNTTQSVERTINIDKLAPITEIDFPRLDKGSVAGDKVSISGWNINPSGVKSVKVYIDDVEISGVTFGESRPDVKTVYSQYLNADKSGFHVVADITNLAAGNRTVKVVQVGNDNTTITKTETFKVERPNPIGVIDYPKSNSTVSGDNLQVSGWSLMSTGVKTINFYIDNTLIKTTTPTVARPDVVKIYSAYKDDNVCGYSANLDISNISAGSRVLKVEQIANNGEKYVQTVNFTRQGLQPVQWIDTPSNNAVISSQKTLKISGWAVNGTGVKKVEILIDGKLKGTATYGIDRPDLQSVFPDYPNAAKAGFQATVDINDVAPGTKQIELRQTGNDGVTYSTFSSIKITKKSPIAILDYPEVERVETSDSLRVAGWGLNESGISKVNVYVDDALVANPSASVSRPDVINAYPGYQTSDKCGFDTSVGISSLKAGTHTLKVEVIGVDGTSTTMTRTFYYKNKYKLVVIDPGHKAGLDDGAYSTFNGVTYSERLLNQQIALRAYSALTASGYNVIFSRKFDVTYDYSVTESLAMRVDLANSLNADMFVSIHQNSADSTSARGTEVYYSSNTDAVPDSLKANKVSVSSSLANTMASTVTSYDGFTNRGPKDAGFYVIKYTKMPAVLIECGFISNETEAGKLSEGLTQQYIANGINDSVRKYI